MFIIETYTTAVCLCVITMLCWGSWANTQKLSTSSWRFELFYWDYSLGIVLTSLILAMTLGSMGTAGRGFLADLNQATSGNIQSAFIGGVVFNAANILLVAAIGITGMSVAFPVGIGIALVLGVLVNYLDQPTGNPVIIFGGVGLITLAIILNAWAYGKRNTSGMSVKGLLIAVVSGCLMGLFYKYVANSMVVNFSIPEVGKLTPYTALVFFAIGILVSSFVFNTIQMYRPFQGVPVSFGDYFSGRMKDHAVGLLGGAIWFIGMAFSIIASEKAGTAISYGLGQGATVVAALWGIYVWKEFDGSDAKTQGMLKLMLALYILGLGLLIYAK
ncbi:MAG: GRP family sugar transporter [Bacteroidota bacterium]